MTAKKPKADAVTTSEDLAPVDIVAEAVVNEGSRDETHDSIDPATGTLTAEAIARRAEMAAEDK